ncbi:hypothetical protein C1H46_018230 [Malus baccata]|uniref:Uncharacterized protein n=1 Tax=Malus baccata TaxID=106549 RepID=A0A540MBP9_MALBA|nr:hypothetical protein C1H46_018230 [Malus baccata]
MRTHHCVTESEALVLPLGYKHWRQRRGCEHQSVTAFLGQVRLVGVYNKDGEAETRPPIQAGTRASGRLGVEPQFRQHLSLQGVTD